MNAFKKLCVSAICCMAWPSLQAQVSVPVPAMTSYTQQCNVCHFAYPPGMLSAQAWRQLVGAMPDHFGASVMVNVETQKEISDWLEQHAGTYAPAANQDPPDHRITQSDWWQNIHRKSPKMPASFWKKPMRLSVSACSACHAQAAAGEFNRHTAKVPK